MRSAIYPGTFDPITNGHLDLIERGLMLFDEIIVAVAPSPKKQPLFSLEQRLHLIRESVARLHRVKVESFDCLLVDYAASRNGVAIIRGLRAVSDYEYELQMTLMNRKLNNSIVTVFMMPSLRYSFLSSTIVKEVASFGGSVSGLVPDAVEAALSAAFRGTGGIVV
jgi:pantetheine-phosphate adenylyltransferase